MRSKAVRAAHDVALGWTATISAVAAAGLMASNIPLSPLSFPLFLFGNFALGTRALLARDWSLLTMQGCMSVLNSIGIVRWIL